MNDEPRHRDQMEDGCAGQLLDYGEAGRQGRLLYLVASLFCQASALLRYVVLARLLGPDQIGLAAALTVTAGFFDLISDTGSDRFLIQDRYGGKAAVQKLVQSVYVMRGIMVSGALLIFAGPIASLYHAPQLIAGVKALAVAPLIAGFLHLDLRRVQRGHDFRAEAVCMIAADATGLLVAVAAALITRDFTAIIYGQIARAAAQVASSHIQARRPYRLGWDFRHAPRLARFAAPLMINGLMIFVAAQSDRMIVGNQLGVRSLGQYSAIMLLIFYPSSVLSNYIHTVFVPMIAARRGSGRDRNRVIDDLGGQVVLIAIAMAAGFAIVAPVAVPRLFGAGFTQPAILIALVGMLQAERFVLVWPTTTALAMGRSTIVMLSNLAHLVNFPAAFLGFWFYPGLGGIVSGFLVGEFFAVALSLGLMNRIMSRQLWHGFDRVLALFLAACLIAGWDAAIGAKAWAPVAGLSFASMAFAVWLCHHEFDIIKEAVDGGRGACCLARVWVRRLRMPRTPVAQ